MELQQMGSSRLRACCCPNYSITRKLPNICLGAHQKKLRDMTDISVYKLCMQLLAELWEGYAPLRLLGIALADLTKEDAAQLSLFLDEGKERSRKPGKARGAISKKLGAATIQHGSNLHSGLRVKEIASGTAGAEKDSE